MKLLVITGDRSFTKAHPRFGLQAEAVEHMEVAYWGPDALFPKIPDGLFDVVSVQDPFLRGVFGFFVARMKRARFNVQVHADIEAQAWWKRMLAGVVLRRADSIRVVSENIARQVRRYTVRAPVRVVPIFVDVERFRKITRVPEYPPVILWVGRFENEKDPLLALRVFKQILKTAGEVRLIMLGSGSLEMQLKKEAAAMPVEFPGWQKDVAPYLAKARVVLSTSRAESWGASIIEALAAGVPVVAPDVGMAKEAGATVVERSDLAGAIIDTLSSRAKGELLIQSYTKEAWQAAWRESLEPFSERTQGVHPSSR